MPRKNRVGSRSTRRKSPATPAAPPATPAASSTKLSLMSSFKEMYENKHFKKAFFDEKGYLKTFIGNNNDNMPLDFFVDYNNMWWFSIIDKVVVPATGYDPLTNTGFIVLDIYYDTNRILRAMQYVKFNNNKISNIYTYASPTFFSANSDSPLVHLDSFGNEIWLTTGYSIDYSVKAALFFFESPKGKSFATSPKTKASVKTIKKQLKNYLDKSTPKS